MKKVLLVVNPSSGGEKAKDYEKLVKEKLETYFEQVDVKHTEKQDDATNFIRQACDQDYHSVFLMGGDGTVNEGINGIAECQNRPKFGFIPLGTVNDLARALNIPLNVKKAVENLNFERTRTLDIGRVNDKFFINVIGIGTLPEALNDTSIEDKTRLGALAYFKKGIETLKDNKSFKFKVTVDGDVKEFTSSLVLICNTRSVGGQDHLVTNAKVNDGILHLTYLKDKGVLDIVKAVPDVLKGIKEDTKNLGYIGFKKAKIELLSDNDCIKINVDGDVGDQLPIEVEILPSYIEVYCGEED